MNSAEPARHKCAACYRQFNKMEYLIEHMKLSFHSQHEPTCDVCKKHCRFYDSLREHLTGSLPRLECAKQFSERGCNLCLRFFKSSADAAAHSAMCRMLPSIIHKHPSIRLPVIDTGAPGSAEMMESVSHPHPIYISAVAMDCQYVGGGQDGSLDLCARLCLIGEDEAVILDSYVKPQIPVTNYRYDLTGIRPENLEGAMTIKELQEQIEQILYNGEAIWKARLKGGKAKILVGHNIENDFKALGMYYPTHLTRDTSKYPPLLKSSKASNSLKYLTQTFLGYTIQKGKNDPYENCMAAMRLYKRMRDTNHFPKEKKIAADFNVVENLFNDVTKNELEQMSPEALLQNSHSDYYCWCLDLLPQP